MMGAGECGKERGGGVRIYGSGGIWTEWPALEVLLVQDEGKLINQGGCCCML
jgi:hypothetical protein